MPRTDSMPVPVRSKRNLPVRLSCLIMAGLAALSAGCASAPLKTEEFAGSKIAVVYVLESGLEEGTIQLVTAPGRVNERMKKLDAIFAQRKDAIAGSLKESLLRHLAAAGIPNIAFTGDDIYSDAVIPLKDTWNAGRRDCAFLKEKGYTHVFIFTFSWIYSHSYLGSQAVYTGFSGYLYRVDDLMNRVVRRSCWRALMTTEKDANGVRTCPLVEFYSPETEERYGEPAILTAQEPLYYRVILSSFNYFLPSAVESLKTGRNIRRVMEEKKIFHRRWTVDEFLKQCASHH